MHALVEQTCCGMHVVMLMACRVQWVTLCHMSAFEPFRSHLNGHCSPGPFALCNTSMESRLAAVYMWAWLWHVECRGSDDIHYGDFCTNQIAEYV